MPLGRLTTISVVATDVIINPQKLVKSKMKQLSFMKAYLNKMCLSQLVLVYRGTEVRDWAGFRVTRRAGAADCPSPADLSLAEHPSERVRDPFAKALLRKRTAGVSG